MQELAKLTKPGGGLLISEPAKHVKKSTFEESIKLAVEAGFEVTARPVIKKMTSAWLRRVD
jgi:hypothetical protein